MKDAFRLYKRLAWRCAIALLLLTPHAGAAPPRQGRAKPAARPAWKDIQATVVATLAADERYRSGDLISQRELNEVFKALQAKGWSPADRKQMLEQALPADAPLVRELRTEAGRKFMRQVGPMPDGYDRLDHLSRLGDGPRIVRKLIAGPDGYKLLEYLTSASGGDELGKMLAKAPDGRDFNRPTGRVYTQAALLSRLKESYARDLAKP